MVKYLASLGAIGRNHTCFILGVYLAVAINWNQNCRWTGIQYPQCKRGQWQELGKQWKQRPKKTTKGICIKLCVVIREESFAEFTEQQGGEMAKKKLKKLHAKDALEFFNQVMVEQPLLPFLVPLVLFAWFVERWVVPFSNWVPLLAAVWATIQVVFPSHGIHMDKVVLWWIWLGFFDVLLNCQTNSPFLGVEIVLIYCKYCLLLGLEVLIYSFELQSVHNSEKNNTEKHLAPLSRVYFVFLLFLF